ncbi:MAG TPA: hypothetical protein VIS07_11305 [Candidatus Binatia bacterium]
MAALTHRSLVAVLVLLVGASACQRTVEHPLFPLEAGRKWIYLITTEPNDGEEPIALQVTTVGPETLEGQRVVRQQIELGDETHFRFMAVDERGVYRYATQSAGEASPTLELGRDDLIVLDPQKGSSWRGEAAFSFLDGPDRVPIESVVELTNDTVDVPAGRFPGCVKVRVSGQARVGERTLTLTEQVWYAKGVGMVKSIVEESESGPEPRSVRVTTELASYSL